LLAEPFLPVFIERDAAGAAPGRDGRHRLDRGRRRGRLERRLAGETLPVRVVEGPPGVLAIEVAGRGLRPR
jgi:hypothetical protein